MANKVSKVSRAMIALEILKEVTDASHKYRGEDRDYMAQLEVEARYKQIVLENLTMKIEPLEIQ